MATTHKRFREIVPPNSNLEFVGKRRLWATVSTFLIVASIAMLFVNHAWRGDMLNWTIDFKGGTEVILGFEEPAEGEEAEAVPVDVGAGKVRSALKDAGFEGFTVADFSWDETNPETGELRTRNGMKVATKRFGAVPKAEQEKVVEEFYATFEDKEIQSATWSGDRLFVRSMQPFDWEEAEAFFEEHGLELKAWPEEMASRYASPQEGTGEYNTPFAVRGVDKQIETAIEQALAEPIDVRVIQTYAIGARAGEKLRNDGIKALFYAMALIMLYLAFRFDVRYAPGAVVALLHDAILVIGVFAVTWQEVSLTTVAALLTVIGYSVNDSVVIFDRIRENVGRLKDKKFARVINISLNETMSRTLLTSITLFVVTLTMNVLGTGLVRNFAFAMNIGVVVGVYSSVFVASPVALAIHNKWFSRQTSAPARAGKKGKGSGKSSGSARSKSKSKSDSDED